MVYKEICRKLCHTRLGEYISATQQNLAALKGKSTLAGQNLRDELLTSHVNTKSFLNLKKNVTSHAIITLQKLVLFLSCILFLSYLHAGKE